MRLFFLILTIGVTLGSVGCNSDLKCRRETALLRAEYLDLEDKYYGLLSQSGSTSAATIASAPSFVTSSGSDVIISDGQPVIYGSGITSVPQADQPGVIYNSVDQYGNVISGNPQPEIIYYDQSAGVPVDGQTYYSSAPYSTAPYATVPTPATSAGPSSGSSLRGSQSAQQPSDDYYPSPVEVPPTDGLDVPSSTPGSSRGTLPAPDSSFNDGQIRLDLDTDNTQPIGHEIKIEMSSPITEVVINRSVSQGKNSDQRPGDDGIELLLQPKSATGDVIDEAGNLTISLVDAAADQGQRQIGQWTFLKEEAELFFAEDEFDNRGILLDLKWDKIIPTNKRLTVYVRFETPDGRIMETTSDIIINPPSGLSLVDGAFDDSKFTSVDRQQGQGWYKSQADSTRGRNDADDRNLNWGRSQRSSDGRFNNRSADQRPSSRQPQWRPAR